MLEFQVHLKNNLKQILLLFAVPALLLAGCGNANTDQSKRIADDNEIVHLHVYNKGRGEKYGKEHKYKDDQQLHFKIPKGYLKVRAANRRGGEQDSIWLTTNLLDLKPDGKHTNQVINDELSNNRLTIVVKRHKSELTEKELNVIAGGHRNPLVIRELEKVYNDENDFLGNTTVYKKDEKDKFGLEHFYNLHCHFYKKMHSTDRANFKKMRNIEDPSYLDDGVEDRYCRFRNIEYFVTPEDYKDVYIYLDCADLPSEKNSGPGRCYAYTRFKGWFIEYYFVGSQLQRWKEIDTKARKLLGRYWVSTPQQITPINN